MNYIKVPDSDIKLTDGSVVMLARFPGTKWAVHYGWYEYLGRQSMGWYFSSIPAQTVIPVTLKDLQLIVLVESGSDDSGSSGTPDVPIPCPPGPCPPPYPPYPPPGPDPWPPGPYPPGPDSHEHFSRTDQYLLDASWITLPSISYRDMLPFICRLPDGKVVKINNEDGECKYYAWNALDQKWEEKFYENDTEELLTNYYTKEEIDEFLADIGIQITALESADIELNEKIDSAIKNIPKYLGESTTVITDGGTEDPTIDGQVVPTSELKTGDWVVYNGAQFIWSDTHWSAYGGTAVPIVVSAENIAIPAAAWKDSEDTTYTKMVQIRMQSVNTDYFAAVEFNDDDSMDYDFASYATIVNDTQTPGSGIITIYCKDPAPDKEIIIPSITCFKTQNVSATAVL